MDKNKCLDWDGNELKVGDRVQVFHMKGCRDFYKEDVIRWISPMHSETDKLMVYFEGGGGAYHPHAIRKKFGATIAERIKNF